MAKKKREKNMKKHIYIYIYICICICICICMYISESLCYTEINSAINKYTSIKIHKKRIHILTRYL